MEVSRRDFLRLSVAAGTGTALSGLIASGVNLGPAVARAQELRIKGAKTRWSQRLMRSACQNGTPKMLTLDGAKPPCFNTNDLFQSSLCQNWQHVREAAADLDVDADAFQAVAARLPPTPMRESANRVDPSSQSPNDGSRRIGGRSKGSSEFRSVPGGTCRLSL
jgi:hypothetical protein